jgi:hypothetical protein
MMRTLYAIGHLKKDGKIIKLEMSLAKLNIKRRKYHD